MTATRQDILSWLEEAKHKKASHLIVMHDTYDHDNYPVFVLVREILDNRLKTNGENMQQIQEIYNMTMDLDMQLAEHRSWHL